MAVKALKMAVVFGECGRECLSEPGNTGRNVQCRVHRTLTTQSEPFLDRLARNILKLGRWDETCYNGHIVHDVQYKGPMIPKKRTGTVHAGKHRLVTARKK